MKLAKNHRRPGAAAIEFALVFPLVFAIFFAFVEHGRYTMVMDLLQNAAREGARYAAVTTTDGQTEAASDPVVEAWIAEWLAGQGANLAGYNVEIYGVDPGNSENFSLPWKDLAYSQLIGVRITGTHDVWLPYFTMLPSTLDLDVRAICMAEAN